ncbi:hypothetical protein SK128_016927, partial [Halocaridina rubra]
ANLSLLQQEIAHLEDMEEQLEMRLKQFWPQQTKMSLAIAELQRRVEDLEQVHTSVAKRHDIKHQRKQMRIP